MTTAPGHLETASGILEAIAAHKRIEVAEAKAALPLERQKALAEQAMVDNPPRDFAAAISAGFAVIGEIKPVSPARGPLREGIGPGQAAELARQYVAGGAKALSVLTDRRFFGGDPALLRAARAAVAVPVLRKDFLLDPYQVYQTRAMGADAALLIAAVLVPDELTRLVSLCRELSMPALVEVHNEEEIAAAERANAAIIGINNRDLNTFAVDLGTTGRLRKHIRPGALVVSESGISSAEDVARLRQHVDAVLVGEALMTSEDPAGLVRGLLEEGRYS